MKREARTITIINFDRYHPLNKTVSAEVRAGGPLKWIRWDVDSHRDPVLLDLPREERWLWPVLLALAGKEQRQPDGARVIRMTLAQLAREADLTRAQVDHAMTHLLGHERIRVTLGEQGNGADHREGGADHREGGYVPTYPRTDVPTDGRTNVRPDPRDARRRRLEDEVHDPVVKDMLAEQRRRRERALA